MTNEKNIELYQNLASITDLKGIKFNYAVARNVALLKSEIESMQSSIKASDQYREFDKRRLDLLNSMAKKDENGRPITANGQYVLEDQEKFNEAFAELKKEFADPIAEFEEQYKKYEEFLKEESSITLHTIDISDVPEEITTSQMNFILPIITGE